MKNLGTIWRFCGLMLLTNNVRNKMDRNSKNEIPLAFAVTSEATYTGMFTKNGHISFIIFTDPNDARMTLRIPNVSAFHGNLISRRLNYTIPTS